MMTWSSSATLTMLNQTKCVECQLTNICKHKRLNTGQIIEVKSGQCRVKNGLFEHDLTGMSKAT